MIDSHNLRTEVSRALEVMTWLWFHRPYEAMHFLNKKGSDGGLFESSSG